MFARYGALDPAGAADEAPDWGAVESVLLATIDERTANVSTQLDHTSTTQTATKRSALGIWVAAAAFAAVIIAGVAVFLAMTGTDEEPADETPVPQVESVPAPPFDSASDAAVAMHVAITNGTAEEIHSLLADDYRGFDMIGPSVVETDERIRFDRAIGFTAEMGTCTVNSPSSSTCALTLAHPLWPRLKGVATLNATTTVRINESGYISSSNVSEAPTEGPIDDLSPEWNEWVIAGNALPWIELDPFADSTGQLEVSPEDAAARYMAAFELFMADRTG